MSYRLQDVFPASAVSAMVAVVALSIAVVGSVAGVGSYVLYSAV